MKWHCGLLDERPENSRTLNYIKRGYWGDPAFPAEIRRELEIWLAMPGFTIRWHEGTLLAGRPTIKQHMGQFERYKPDVVENWLSATRDDCVRLARTRAYNRGDIPLLCKLQMLKDLKAGAKRAELVRDYRVHPDTITRLQNGAILSRAAFPPGFELLIRGS